MQPLHLQIGITLDENSVAALIVLMRRAFPETTVADDKRARRSCFAVRALFGGQEPPEDKGLLIEIDRRPDLLKVSQRTLWRMWNEGEMPLPIRVGRAIRWSYEGLEGMGPCGLPGAGRPVSS